MVISRWSLTPGAPSKHSQGFKCKFTTGVLTTGGSYYHCKVVWRVRFLSMMMMLAWHHHWNLSTTGIHYVVLCLNITQRDKQNAKQFLKLWQPVMAHQVFTMPMITVHTYHNIVCYGSSDSVMTQITHWVTFTSAQKFETNDDLWKPAT